jgi:hypothetical protein
MVCFRNICVNTLHKGDSIFTNNNNNNNNYISSANFQASLYAVDLVSSLSFLQPSCLVRSGPGGTIVLFFDGLWEFVSGSFVQRGTDNAVMHSDLAGSSQQV